MADARLNMTPKQRRNYYPFESTVSNHLVDKLLRKYNADRR